VSGVLKLKFTTHPIITKEGGTQEDVDFALVLDSAFDEIPLKGNKNYALYNNILIEIRNARKKDEETIDVTKSDLEQLKQILIAATEGNSKLNRRVSFLTEVIDNAITSDIVQNSTPEVE